MKTVVRGAHVLVGEDLAEDSNIDVAVVDGRIELLPAGATTSSKSADVVVDADGRWLLPGLIDAHIHLCIPKFQTTRAARIPASPNGPSRALQSLASSTRAISSRTE